MELKLFVGNLPFTTSEDDVRTLFAQAGEVTSVALIKDRDTGRSKGFAFVEMPTKSEAEAAIAGLNGKMLQEKALVVNEARPKSESKGSYGNRGSFNNRGGYSSGRQGGRPGSDFGGRGRSRRY